MVTKQYKHYMLLAAAFLLYGQMHATVVSTRAATGAEVLRTAFEWHAKLHNGEIASSWEQLASQVDPAALRQTLTGSATDRFTFYGQTGPNDSRKGQVVLVTNNTIVENGRETPGRYVVWHKSGKFGMSWIGEQAAAELFAHATVTLPALGIWQQNNTNHAVKMMGIEEPFKLDDKGNVISGKPGTDRQPNLEAFKDAKEGSSGRHTMIALPKTDGDVKSSVQIERSSWLVWLLMVLAATAGAAWVFLRKSK